MHLGVRILSRLADILLQLTDLSNIDAKVGTVVPAYHANPPTHAWVDIVAIVRGVVVVGIVRLQALVMPTTLV